MLVPRANASVLLVMSHKQQNSASALSSGPASLLWGARCLRLEGKTPRHHFRRTKDPRVGFPVPQPWSGPCSGEITPSTLEPSASASWCQWPPRLRKAFQHHSPAGQSASPHVTWQPPGLGTAWY